MKNIKWRIFIPLIAVVCIISVLATGFGIKHSMRYNEYKDSEVQKLFAYGDKLEQMDIPPNTIVARFNGEEILFREIETYRRSINNYIADGHKDGIGKSAFYEVVKNKLQAQLAKEYSNVKGDERIRTAPDKLYDEWYNGTEDRTAEQFREEYLEVLYIEENEIWLDEEDFVTYLQYISMEFFLISNGISIINDFMLEKPEMANDDELIKKVEEYNSRQQRQEISNDMWLLLREIEDLFTRDLIMNSDLQLCVDDMELSYTVPEVDVNKW